MQFILSLTAFILYGDDKPYLSGLKLRKNILDMRCRFS